MEPRKWQKEIKMWADGADVEYRYPNSKKPVWIKTGNPSWGNDSLEFRIKPQQKEPQYLYVYKEPTSDCIGLKSQVFITTEKGLYFGNEPIGKIKLEQEK